MSDYSYDLLLTTYDFLKTPLHKNITFFSILLYAVSLTQKAFCSGGDCYDSVMLALVGALGVPIAIFGSGSMACITWVANPLLVFAWLTLYRSKIKTALLFSLAASLIAASFLLFKTIPTDEGGTPHPITGYGIGYWLWLSACCSMMLGSAGLYLRKRVL